MVKAFTEFKTYLLSLKILSLPKENKSLFLYLRVSNQVVSVVLVRKENGVQCSVYYYNRTLHDAEIIYLKVEKMALALVSA